MGSAHTEAPADVSGGGNWAETVAGNDPLLDSAVLAQLEGLLGRAVLDDMLTLVPRSIAEELARIDQALARGDGPAVQRAAHTLKGLGGNLGLGRLARSAARLDRHLKEFPGTAPQARHLSDRLSEAAHETLDALAQRG